MDERSWVFIILVMVGIGITGCVNQSGTGDPGSLTPDLLTRGTWQLLDADKNPQFDRLIPGTTITLTFSLDGTVSGSAGCNSYSGTWAAKEDSMIFRQLSLTKMSCESPEIMKTEGLYMPLLQETATYSVNDEYLNLTGDSACTLIYQRK
jgi:heat shock protein HslJ